MGSKSCECAVDSAGRTLEQLIGMRPDATIKVELYYARTVPMINRTAAPHHADGG